MIKDLKFHVWQMFAFSFAELNPIKPLGKFQGDIVSVMICIHVQRVFLKLSTLYKFWTSR